MRRVAIICCSKCKHSIAEICVEEIREEEADSFVPQVDTMRQYFGIPPYYCGECIGGNQREDADNESK